MILLKINGEENLYNRYDPSRTRMSGDLFSYIKTCFEEVPLSERKDTEVHVISETPVDADVVKTLICSATDRELDTMRKKQKENRLKMWRLYIIGVVLIIVGFALALSLDQLILEVISIIGSMAVKDAATIQIEHNPDIRIRMMLLEQLKNIRVTA